MPDLDGDKLTMVGVELYAIRVYLGQQRLEVLVIDRGVKRVIDYQWRSQGEQPAPPPSWWSAVCGEIEWQRTQDEKRTAGTLVPNY